MTLHRNTSLGVVLIAVIASALLLGGCGQTGELYMPETHSTKPPPPRESRLKKKPKQTPQGESADNTQQTDKGN